MAKHLADIGLQLLLGKILHFRNAAAHHCIGGVQQISGQRQDTGHVVDKGVHRLRVRVFGENIVQFCVGEVLVEDLDQTPAGGHRLTAALMLHTGALAAVIADGQMADLAGYAVSAVNGLAPVEEAGADPGAKIDAGYHLFGLDPQLVHVLLKNEVRVLAQIDRRRYQGRQQLRNAHTVVAAFGVGAKVGGGV